MGDAEGQLTPNLLHPVPVTFARLVSDQTVVDLDARELVHGSQESVAETYVVDGQVHWGNLMSAQPQPGGARHNADGYILCRWADVVAAIGGDMSKFFNDGDRVKAIGDYLPSGGGFYIHRVTPLGHYPDQGGATLVKFHLQDREPSKPSRSNG